MKTHLSSKIFTVFGVSILKSMFKKIFSSKRMFLPTGAADKFGLKTLLSVMLLSFVNVNSSSAETASDSAGVPYTVECPETGACKVDKGTFKGWRSYHAFCHVCHAQDAVGSTFAPSLLDRMKDMKKDRFVAVVTNGFTGQIGVMPAWKDNPNVMPRIDDLWSYLRARSDGVLKPGRPDK